jgi:hypothetical protein
MASRWAFCVLHEYLAYSPSTDIYGHSENVKKTKFYLPMIPPKGDWRILTAIDKELHRHKREFFSKTLSDEVFRNFEPIMIDSVDVLCRKLIEDLDSSNWSSPDNMIDLCKCHRHRV